MSDEGLGGETFYESAELERRYDNGVARTASMRMKKGGNARRVQNGWSSSRRAPGVGSGGSESKSIDFA